MKAKYTHVSILLDESGSMQTIAPDIIGGFNELIEKQKGEEGESTVSLSTFSSRGIYKKVLDFSPLDKIENLSKANYSPMGATALNDSFARLIQETGLVLNNLPENERPENVLIVSITDGEENNSVEFTTEQLKTLIKEQEEKYNWKFLYIGANQDSFQEGVQARGFTQAMNFMATSDGTRNVMGEFSTKYSSLRTTGKL